MEQPKKTNPTAKRVRKPVDKKTNKDGDIEGSPSSSVTTPGPTVPPPSAQAG